MGVLIYPPSRTLHIRYGEDEIKFARLPRSSGINRVLIKVHPDCRVEVTAPDHADDAEIVAAVRKRGRWIFERLRDFQAQLRHVAPRRYMSGESELYLGKRYQLKVLGNSKANPGVRLLRGSLEVTTRSKDADTVKQLLNEWFKARAKEVFSKRLDDLLEQALWVGQQPTMRILSMKTQWGSCSPNGTLTLNPHLVKASRECIDYVILHELCHIAEHNHSKRFHRLMKQVMPNWEKTKERLDGMANQLLR
jgi:predicted metal-dependent hydrolase